MNGNIWRMKTAHAYCQLVSFSSRQSRKMKFGHPINKNKSKVSIFLFTCCCSIAIWNSGKCVQKYLSYDIKTSVIYSHADKLQFPAVTVCHTNMFRRSIVGGSKQLMVGLVKFFSQSRSSFEDLYEKVSGIFWSKL